jgi:hypothetical protein
MVSVRQVLFVLETHMLTGEMDFELLVAQATDTVMVHALPPQELGFRMAVGLLDITGRRH